MTAAKPSGAGAVMAQRGTSVVDALDYFPTPPWAARAGGELVKRLDPAARTCWEPACGEGHMAYALADYFDLVLASDIHDYGFGDVADFLEDDSAVAEVDWIITNPPFAKGEAFARRALTRARRGVAMLLRSVFLESIGRYPLFSSSTGFALVAQFAERVPMVKGRWDPDASTATSYAWFIWLKPRADLSAAYWAGLRERLGGEAHFGVIIAPGARQRLSRPADHARFCSADAGELFK